MWTCGFFGRILSLRGGILIWGGGHSDAEYSDFDLKFVWGFDAYVGVNVGRYSTFLGYREGGV